MTEWVKWWSIGPEIVFLCPRKWLLWLEFRIKDWNVSQTLLWLFISRFVRMHVPKESMHIISSCTHGKSCWSAVLCLNGALGLLECMIWTSMVLTSFGTWDQKVLGWKISEIRYGLGWFHTMLWLVIFETRMSRDSDTTIWGLLFTTDSFLQIQCYQNVKQNSISGIEDGGFDLNFIRLSVGLMQLTKKRT